MRIGRLILVLAILLCLAGMTYAQETLSQEDKAYLDGLNQKTVAQISGKIDAQSNAIGKDFKEQVNLAKEDLRVSITEEMKGALKGITIGLGGMIIVVLSVFRIIDTKFIYSNKVKKYESELQKKTKEYEELIKNTKQQYEDNEKLKKELNIYKSSIDKYATSIGITPQFNMQGNYGYQNIPQPPNIKKKGINIIWIFIFIVIVIVLFFIAKALRLF